jgi:hypothetical protein
LEEKGAHAASSPKLSRVEEDKITAAVAASDVTS